MRWAIRRYQCRVKRWCRATVGDDDGIDNGHVVGVDVGSTVGKMLGVAVGLIVVITIRSVILYIGRGELQIPLNPFSLIY